LHVHARIVQVEPAAWSSPVAILETVPSKLYPCSAGLQSMFAPLSKVLTTLFKLFAKVLTTPFVAGAEVRTRGLYLAKQKSCTNMMLTSGTTVYTAVTPRRRLSWSYRRTQRRRAGNESRSLNSGRTRNTCPKTTRIKQERLNRAPNRAFQNEPVPPQKKSLPTQLLRHSGFAVSSRAGKRTNPSQPRGRGSS
jgi:hypothetical protein